MNVVHFGNIRMFYLLWLIPVFVALFAYARHRRAQLLGTFADPKAVARLTANVDYAGRRWKAVLFLVATGLIALGLTRPGWNPKPIEMHSQGRDVVFVVDVSRSMLAEDLAPNRLERAKLAILDTVERLSGDRIALVAFAGTAAVKCPLTLDYGFFRASVEALYPGTIARGGTLIGDALRRALDEVFDDAEKQFKDIILITDGEDHDSDPIAAAEEAGSRGVRLLAIGLGDENEGKRIPITDEYGNKVFLTYDGQEVWSRLDADVLREMAYVTPGGRYLNVATGTFDLGTIYEKLVATSEQRELEAKTVERYEEKFQIFLIAAFVLLSAETLISERRRKARLGEKTHQ